METSTQFAGHFLIAMPGLQDPNFERGVTLLCQHNEEGAIGLMVNRLSGYRMGDVLEQMQLECTAPDLAEMPVLVGGPLQQERGFVLHRDGSQWESSYQFAPRWSVTTSRDILVAMAAGKGPDDAIIALGYSGWDAGQLEQELIDNAWLTTPALDHIVFDTPADQRWSAATSLTGIDPAQLAGYAGHA